MKKYLKPTLELVEFPREDVLTLSNEKNDNLGDDNFGFLI